MTAISGSLEKVIAYHQATKHHFRAYARGPGYLDWETQPDPFRRYEGAPLIPLEFPQRSSRPSYDQALTPGTLEPEALSLHTISRLFYDSLAISAWKEAGGMRWALRVNPSSGNLHPTEGYLVCGQVAGLCSNPMVVHYVPREHALERRAEVPETLWKELASGLPDGVLLVGLTSIHWREAWKYGERAYRYCQHDAGHAIAAVRIAAAGLGWNARLLDDLGTDEIAEILGVTDPAGAEAEHPDCLLAISPRGELANRIEIPEGVPQRFRSLTWTGRPNRLSPDHVEWPVIEEIAEAIRKPRTRSAYENALSPNGIPIFPNGSHPSPQDLPRFQTSRLDLPLRRLVRQRRSALDMDGRTEIARDVFFRILSRTMPGRRRGGPEMSMLSSGDDSATIPFDALPWPPAVHLLLFVHRVRSIPPGLYFLVRRPGALESLRSAMREDFEWIGPEGCPDDLGLYLLARRDVREISRAVSCHQEIASDGCFSLGMIAEFEGILQKYGAWFYPRLFWECGVIGQVLYLEAEAAGIRGTGIGCFFDDPVHELLGLRGLGHQSLYHFTVGGPVEDPRLTTLPAYPPPE